jgi:NADH-quinone oxidoreductase subunit L
MSGEQDMRKMGGLRAKLPITSTTFIVAALAIAGVPPLAGFFSKDEILWQAFSSPLGSRMLWATGLLVAGLTALYMFRQVFMVFFGECRADHETQHHLHESPRVMTLPLQVLMVGSVVAGLLWIPHVFLPFEHWLEPVMGHHAAAATEHATAGTGTELGLMLLSVVVALSGIGLASLMYLRRTIDPERFAALFGGFPHRVLYNKYFVDELYGLVFVRGGLALCRMAAWFDLHVIDGVVNASAAVTRAGARLVGGFDHYFIDGAVNGVAEGTQFVGRRIRNVQTGAISAYLYVVTIGVLGGVLVYWSWAAAS